MKEVIRLENVFKIYINGKTELRALNGVDFSVKEGDFIAIMGASGSGKSTMLHICGLLDKPTKGDVYFEGIRATRLSDSQIAEIRNKKIGFVFQQFNLIPHLSALENVYLPKLFSGTENNEEGEVYKLLKSVGLEGKENRRPNELSGGEQQRVAIARALMNNPDIIMADEPTGNLDSKTGKQIMEILNNLHKNFRKTILIVTHDPQIAKCAERVISIKDGRIIKDHNTAKTYLWRK